MVQQFPVVSEVLAAVEARYLALAGVRLHVHRQLDAARERGAAARPRAHVLRGVDHVQLHVVEEFLEIHLLY